MSHAVSRQNQKIIRLVIILLIGALLAVLFAFMNNKQIASQSSTSVINGISPEPFGRRGISPEPFGRRFR